LEEHAPAGRSKSGSWEDNSGKVHGTPERHQGKNSSSPLKPDRKSRLERKVGDMDLKTYFTETEGSGILATADSAGKVDAAVYSRPNFMEDGQIVFITADRLTHQNLQSNPYAVYLFMETGQRWKGKRLYLKKTKEESDPDKVEALMRRKHPQDVEKYKDLKKFLVYFTLEQERPLTGEKE